jgi:hypothetical protein
MFFEYGVFCLRSEPLTLEEVARLAPAGMSARAHEALDGFVVEARDLSLGIFPWNADRLEQERSRFTVDPNEVSTTRYFAPVDVVAKLRAMPRGLTVSYLRGEQCDPRAEKFLHGLLVLERGYVRHLWELRDAEGHALTQPPDDIKGLLAGGRSPTAPGAERVLERGLCLAAVTMRGVLENEALEDVAGPLARLRDWTRERLADGFEPSERAVLDAPPGTLDRATCAAATWRAEGLAVLAWAMNASPLPEFEEPANAAEISSSLGFLQSAPAPTVRLRDLEELDALSSQLFTAHWRLREFQLTGKSMDLVSFAKGAWFGPLDVEGLPLARVGFLGTKRDLAVGKRPIARAAEEDIFRATRMVEERLRASRWLSDGGVYSDVDMSS